MTSWHGRAFCCAGPLWGESTDHRLIPMLKGYCCGALINWDIFFKWNAFEITVMSCSICPGFNVLWWHHAVDTPSTVWFNDWRVVVNSATDLLTPSRAAYPEIFTHGSLLSILPISPAINPPTCTLKHLHNKPNANEATMKDMGIWATGIQQNAYIKSNKSQQNHVRIYG